MTNQPYITTQNDLQDFITRAFVSCGIEAQGAATAARLMARADVIGQDGHGVFRLPQYIRRIRAGGINPTPQFNTLEDRAATALVDGDNGMGHLVMHHATELAMKKAETTGVAWVGVRNSNHAGPASLYAMMPLKKDMIGLYVAVASANHMPPWGGTTSLLGTNPIAVAVPSGANPPIVLDMATTVAAYGKVKTAAQRGETMPKGWMIDHLGRAITDPAKSSDGFLLPIGGAKGYGLALIFGILAGTLNGAAFGRDVVDFNADATTQTNTGQFILALDIKAFADPDVFRSGIDRVWDDMKSSQMLPNVDEIRIPGERLDWISRDRAANGIPIAGALKTQLDKLAVSLNIKPL